MKITNGSDQKIYREELAPLLPPRIFDAHVHIFRKGYFPPGFAFKPRSEKALAPEFPAGAKLVVKRGKGRLRGVKRKSKGRVVDVWSIEIPAATAVRSARAGVFEITVTGKDGAKAGVFGLINESARFPVTDPRSQAPSVFRVACNRLPADGLTFSVWAISCWGKRSAPLTVST